MNRATASALIACRAIMKKRPTKLSELEAAIGSLDRDVTGPDAYRIDRKGLFGFAKVSIAFIGHRLRDEADPTITEIELRMPAAVPPVLDLRALAVEVLGAGVDKEDSWPDYEQGGTYFSKWLEWEHDKGRWQHFVHDADALKWSRLVPADAPHDHSEDEEIDLVGKIVALVAQPFRLATLEQVFGALDVDGRGAYYTASGPRWHVLGCWADALENIHVGIDPPLPIARLATALGWHDVYLEMHEPHDLSWTVHETATRVRVGGGGVKILIHVPYEHQLERRPDIDAYEAQAIEGAVIEGITIRPRPTSLREPDTA